MAAGTSFRPSGKIPLRQQEDIRRHSVLPKRLKRSIPMLLIPAMLFIINIGCVKKPPNSVELTRFPIDNMDNLDYQPNVFFDQTTSSDGKGSLRIIAADSTTIRLYNTGELDVENAHLTYQAKLKTKDLKGRTYLEMWCHFPGRGEFFSRDLQSPLTGTTDWSTEETYFFLKEGDRPDNIRLNLVVAGSGTVWIDDIRILKTPFESKKKSVN